MPAQTEVTISPIGCLIQNDSIVLKDIVAKPDLKSPWLFTNTPLAD